MSETGNPLDNLGSRPEKNKPETNFTPQSAAAPLSEEEKKRIKSLASEGKGVNEIARILGRSPATVSRTFKKLNISQAVALIRAGKFVEEKLNAGAQLKKINEKINLILDDATRREQEQGTPDPELAIKAAAEIRNQLKLQLEIFQTLYNVEEVARWQNEILDILGEVAPDARERFYERLQHRRSR
jgi:IS30 family transposase